MAGRLQRERENQKSRWFFVLFSFIFETWFHLAQAGFKHTMQLRMVLNFSQGLWLQACSVIPSLPMERFCPSHPKVLRWQGAVQQIRSGCWVVITFFVHAEICYVASIITKELVVSHHVLRGCYIPFQMLTASDLVPSCRIFPGMGTHDLGLSLRSTHLCLALGKL